MAPVDGPLKAGIGCLLRCLRSSCRDGSWRLMGRCCHTIFSWSWPFRWHKRLGRVDTIVCAPILLQLGVVEGGRSVLHEGHRRVGGVIEGSIIAVWVGMGIVEPSWHTHVDATVQRPIWTTAIISLNPGMIEGMAQAPSGAGPRWSTKRNAR